MKLPGIEGYAALGYDVIPGWFRPEDFELFDLILDHQLALGITGDILEIGCYRGRSAIALGYGLRDDERLWVVDLFEDHDGGISKEGMAVYEGLTQKLFEKNYQGFHDKPNVVLKCSSTDLRFDVEEVFRFIHVDGGHDHATVAADIDTAVHASREGTVIAIDDYRTHHTPGVAAAVWTAMGDRDIYPFLLSEVKMYACTSAADYKLWLAAAKTWGYDTELHDIDGMQILRKKDAQ